jgi:hypothetical protein
VIRHCRGMPKAAIRAEQRFRVLHRDGFRCMYCGKSAIDGACLSVSFHADHVFPKSLGATTEDDDLLSACADCNLGKSDLLLSALPPGVTGVVVDKFEKYCDSLRNVPRADAGERIRAWDRELLELLCEHPAWMRGEFGEKVLEEDDFESRGTYEVFVAVAELRREGRGSITASDIRSYLDGTQFYGLIEQSLLGLIKHFDPVNPVSLTVRMIHFVKSLSRRRANRRANEIAYELKDTLFDEKKEASLFEQLVSMRRMSQGGCDPRDGLLKEWRATDGR